MNLKNAKPEKSKSGYVWWGAPDDRCNPVKGLIPFTIRGNMQGDIENPPGNSGTWFSTEQAALDELQRVIAAMDALKQLELTVKVGDKVVDKKGDQWLRLENNLTDTPLFTKLDYPNKWKLMAVGANEAWRHGFKPILPKGETKKKHEVWEVWIVWGSSSEVQDRGRDSITYHVFETKKELTAFFEGVNCATGWSENQSFETYKDAVEIVTDICNGR